MTVTIQVPELLRGACAGATELSVDAPDVRAALGEVELRFPKLFLSICDETGAVRRHVNLFVNDLHVRERGGLDTPLQAGDVIHVLPAVSGG